MRGLLGGQHLGDHVLDPRLACHGVCNRARVAGHEPHGDPEALELPDRGRRLRLHRVADRDCAHQPPVTRKEHGGAAVASGRRDRRPGSGQVHAALGQEGGVAGRQGGVAEHPHDAATAMLSDRSTLGRSAPDARPPR